MAKARKINPFLFTSPSVRATLGELEEVIGQIYFTVTDQLPYDSEANVIEGELMSIEEAQAAVSFGFALPDYLPAGYINSGLAGLRQPNELVDQVVQIMWQHSSGDLIELSVHAYDPAKPIHTVVGPDSIESVMIAGQEAALICGGWDSDRREWSRQYQSITLLWELNGVQYGLLGYGDGLSVDELLAVAESIHPWPKRGQEGPRITPHLGLRGPTGGGRPSRSCPKACLPGTPLLAE